MRRKHMPAIISLTLKGIEMTFTIILIAVLAFSFGFLFGVIAMGLVAASSRHDDEEGRR